MSDEFKPAGKPAGLSEGDVKSRRDNDSQEAVSPTETPSPDIEAEPGQDPQAPNRKGLG